MSGWTIGKRHIALIHQKGVAPPILTSITLTGASSTIMTHNTAAYVAVGYDQVGSVLSFTPIFASSDTGKATINSSSGVASPVAAGTTNITAHATNSVGTVITSNAITLTVSAQVATSVTVSPSSFSIAPAGTQQLTATVYDQATSPNAISGASVSWGSSDTGKATVNSSGLVTGVAAGSPIITATSGSASGTSSGTVTPASGVTSVSLFYNSAAAGNMLFRTGSTYTLVAKDQDGNVLDGSVGTWSSSDATNAPINSSSGIVSPSALTAATFTYTHTASGHTGTATATVLLATTPMTGMVETVSYANDAALRAAIRSTVTTGSYVSPAPTGSSSATYQDGVNEGLITLDATRPFMGNQSLLMRFPASEQSYTWLAAAFPSGHTTLTRAWAMTVKRYDTGFTPTGSGVGGAASYKDGPFFGWGNQPAGRAGVVYTNATQIDYEAYTQNGPSSTGGIGETYTGTSVTTEWTNQQWIADIILYEAISVSVMSIRLWRFQLGTNPTSGALIVQAVGSGPMNAGVAVGQADSIMPMGLNYNQTRNAGQTLYKSVGYWEAVDGNVYGDPYGLLNDTSTPTLSSVSPNSVAHGASGTSITLTGTNFTTNCWPQFSNLQVYPQGKPTVGGGGTTLTFTINVDASATTGAGTVSVANACSQHTSGTQVFTVT